MKSFTGRASKFLELAKAYYSRIWRDVENRLGERAAGVLRRIFPALLGVLVAAALFAGTGQANRGPRTELQKDFIEHSSQWMKAERDISVLQQDARDGRVKAIGVASPRLLVTLKDDSKYFVEDVGNDSARTLEKVQDLARGAVATTRLPDSVGEEGKAMMDSFLSRLSTLILLITPLLILRLLSKQMGTGSKAALLAEKPDTTFDDVIGASEAKASLQQVKSFLTNPQQFTALGARPPRGVLLAGPPGTGKTLLARALAGEAKANFIAVDGSSFTSMFLEQGIKRVQSLFAKAREQAPCIVFIDEIDALGARSSGPNRSPGQSEENRIITKLLVEMDGFAPSEGVTVLAASNHIEAIDPALRRSGRFDTIVNVTTPNQPERARLFDLYLNKVRKEDSLDVESLARMTPGMTGADISAIVNRAAIDAATLGDALVSHRHVKQALEDQQLGAPSLSMKELMSPEVRERVAVHEAGHALVGHAVGAGVMEGVTIDPRGRALGVTRLTRENQIPLFGEAELFGQLQMLLAGREAEAYVYGDTSSGASDDLKRASELAYAMVGKFGFSKQFGLMSLDGLPPELLSTETKEAALTEVRDLLNRAQQEARRLLDQKSDRLHALKDELLQSGTVSGPRTVEVLTS